ncbi:hypothetical protein HMPREF9696_00172 [Afipia clevelandensis ATCC 49720]|uniref:Uncharacterized protein n=1 Tax=Afipia clevelandensis ATCC 49720 TaxID=883079 RepID=K8PP80_9BRAD|nr:hypothetical protein HMPREF9696_00172 [Afipia clevelandensis ATCC 49720]
MSGGVPDIHVLIRARFRTWMAGPNERNQLVQCPAVTMIFIGRGRSMLRDIPRSRLYV